MISVNREDINNIMSRAITYCIFSFVHDVIISITYHPTEQTTNHNHTTNNNRRQEEEPQTSDDVESDSNTTVAAHNVYPSKISAWFTDCSNSKVWGKGIREIRMTDHRLQTCLQLLERNVAQKGNGRNGDLSRDQWDLLHQLHDRVAPYRDDLPEEDKDFCDLETCRRYLVARQWNLKKAEAQLISTLKWRKKENPSAKHFWQSPKALENPLAFNMRIVGWDKLGRPINYTCFAEAHDRWDSEAVGIHVQLVLEACQNLIRQRRQRGLNPTAVSRQAVWVVDFDGFGLRDQDPRAAVITAHLLQHYPEMMSLVVLIDAPVLFNGVFRLMSPLLDERIKSKIMFVKGKEAGHILQERLGMEAAQWIEQETMDNKEKRVGAKNQKGGFKKYWIAPRNRHEHNPRGIDSYIQSDLYVKTPGDAFEERKQKQEKKLLDGIFSGTSDEPAGQNIRVATLLRGSSFPDSAVCIDSL